MLSCRVDGTGEKSALQQMGPTPNFPRPLRNRTPQNLLLPSHTWQICSRRTTIHLPMREQAYGRAAGNIKNLPVSAPQPLRAYVNVPLLFMCIPNFSISFHFDIYAGHFRQIVSLDFKPGTHLKKLLGLYLTNSHLKTWDWCSDFCNHSEINRHLTGCHISKYFEIFNSKSHWFKVLHNLTMRRFFIVSTGLSGSAPPIFAYIHVN